MTTTPHINGGAKEEEEEKEKQQLEEEEQQCDNTLATSLRGKAEEGKEDCGYSDRPAGRMIIAIDWCRWSDKLRAVGRIGGKTTLRVPLSIA